MKTILDKIDPKYIECTAGVCEHTSHAHVLPVYVVAVLAVVCVLYRTRGLIQS